MRANRKIYIKKIVLSTHMHETRLDREVEIYPRNQTNNQVHEPQSMFIA
jgi:hypothetical protein